MNTIKLNNGVEMPQSGFGTLMIPKEKLSRTIAEAYEMGYRQFDTAWRYHNEVDIAKALKENGINRQDVFITTKVTAAALYVGEAYRYGYHSLLNVRNFKSIRSVIEESFKALDTDYIDLFLVHWPFPIYRKMYSELTKLYHQGRIRAIGVCSFLPPHIESLKEISDVVPAVNQFEISPLNTQKPLIKYCQRNGIAVEAMSTFSHFRSVEHRKEIFENAQLQTIADKYGKSIVQIVLKWLLQQKIIIIPKTWDVNHMRENIDLYDFELSKEEMELIDSLDQGRFLNYNPYVTINYVPRKYRLQWAGF